MLVGLDRVELSTSRLSGVRSNHLSYRPVMTVLRQTANLILGLALQDMYRFAVGARVTP